MCDPDRVSQLLSHLCISKLLCHSLNTQTLAAKREQVAEVEKSQDALAKTKATLHKDRVGLEKKLSAKQKEMEKKVKGVFTEYVCLVRSSDSHLLFR